MSRQRTLTPQQREQTTMLFAEQNDLEVALGELRAEIKGLGELSQARAVPRITVRSMLHPGTSIRIGAFELQVKDQTKGPISAIIRYEKVVFMPLHE